MSRDYSCMLRGADDEQECALRVDLHRTSSLDFKTSRLSATAAGGEKLGRMRGGPSSPVRRSFAGIQTAG